MLENLQLTIANWSKYNPRKDIKNPTWFAISNRMIEDSDIFELTHGEFRAWVYCLSRASQKNSDNVEIDLRHAKRVCGVSVADFNGMIDKLLKCKALYVSRTATYAGVQIPSTTDRQTNRQTILVDQEIDHAHPLEISCDKPKEPSFLEKANFLGKLWNDYAEDNGLAKVKLPLGKDRIALLRAPLAEITAPDDWSSIFHQVGQNSFRIGENDRGWKANFDWLFHKTKFNYRKMLEEYDSDQERNNDTRGQSSEENGAGREEVPV